MTQEQQPTLMCTECEFDLKSPCDLAIHLTEQHQHQKKLYQCLRCNYATTDSQNLRKHEGGMHFDYEENRDFIKEEGVKKPFKCMKCDHRSGAKAHITRHLFTVHSSEVINRKRKVTPTAEPVKRTRLDVTIKRTVPEPHMLREKNKRFKE